MNTTYEFDWGDLAFASKKPLKDLKATFITAPRQLSYRRLKELVASYLKEGNNVILGLSKEPFVEGFDGQRQFKMLEKSHGQGLASIINAQLKGVKLYTLEYFQRELPYILEKVPFKKVILVRGSWRGTFHTSPAYYLLAKKQVMWRMESPFSDEKEAKKFAALHRIYVAPWLEERKGKSFDSPSMLGLAAEAAKFSFDYSFQTGTALSRREANGRKYKLVLTSFNKVVPYQTYAMHWGNTREINLSPPHDLNHYDTVHAEVELIVEAGRQKLDLAGTTLFINLLPCPMCARMFAETDIEEFVYSVDHSEGYAVRLLEAAGKKVRRLV